MASQSDISRALTAGVLGAESHPRNLSAHGAKEGPAFGFQTSQHELSQVSASGTATLCHPSESSFLFTHGGGLRSRHESGCSLPRCEKSSDLAIAFAEGGGINSHSAAYMLVQQQNTTAALEQSLQQFQSDRDRPLSTYPVRVATGTPFYATSHFADAAVEKADLRRPPPFSLFANGGGVSAGSEGGCMLSRTKASSELAVAFSEGGGVQTQSAFPLSEPALPPFSSSIQIHRRSAFLRDLACAFANGGGMSPDSPESHSQSSNVRTVKTTSTSRWPRGSNHVVNPPHYGYVDNGADTFATLVADPVSARAVSPRGSVQRIRELRSRL